MCIAAGNPVARDGDDVVLRGNPGGKIFPKC